MKARPQPAISASGCLTLIEGRLGSILVYFVLLPLMLCLVLIIPPIELPTRIASAGYVSVAPAGVEVHDADGASLAIPEGAVRRGSSVKLTSLTRQAFVGTALAQTLPSYLEVKSPLYSFAVQGERPKDAKLSIPIPNDAEPNATLDLYARYADQWFKIPFLLNEPDTRLESDLNFVPDAVVVAQTRPQGPLVSAILTNRTSPPAGAAKVLVEVNPAGLRLADEGAVAGDVLALPETADSSPFAVVPLVSNIDEQGPRLDLTGNMIHDETQRTAHIRTLVDLAVQKLYAGYDIAYEGLGLGDRDAFTAFIKELARQLHAQNKLLAVTLPAPTAISEEDWDTAGYDWALIGRYADQVKIPGLADPHAFEGERPLAEQYLQWATGQVDRYKLQVVFSAKGLDEATEQFKPVAFEDALKAVGPINLPATIRPGDQVTLDLPGLRAAGGIQHHDPSGLFYFNYKDDKGTQHTVWLANADSLARWAALLLKYNLHGLALRDVDTTAGADKQVWQVLANYRRLEPTNVGSTAALVWLVDGKKVGKSSAADPKFVWTAPADAGKHTIQVALSVDDGQSFTPGGEQLALNVEAKPTPPPPTPVPTARPTEPAPTSAAAKPTARPATAPAAPPSNFTGKNMFGYGMQLNWTGSPLGNDGEMGTLNGMGFGWAKIQVRWCDLQSGTGAPDLSSLDNMNAVAKQHNIKLLFSVMCGPEGTGATSVDGNPGPPADPNLLGQFVGTLAQRYCPAGGNALGAIEVWNETNLSREWGTRPLNGGDYVAYLRVAYAAIKQNCPGIVVVSGAPTPTGVNNQYAISDDVYLQQMYSAGLKSVSDAIGIHPSGYNVPVDCDITNPGCAASGQSWLAPWQSRHYSFSFLSMMNRYRAIMVANGDGSKQLWATEFGWGVTPNPFPGYEYERDTTVEQQASWLVGAYRYAKSWGWVGVMFVWNLDFTSGENAAFAVLNRPAQSALSAMPK